MKINITKNIWFIILSITVGFLYSLPNIYFSIFPAADNVYIPLSSSELLYGAQVRELLEGHFVIGDPQFIEYKYTFPSAFAYLPIYFLGLFSTITNSITLGFTLSDFIIPVLLFVVLTKFVYKIINNHIYSMLASLSVLVIYPLTTKIPPLIPNLFQGLVDKLFLLNVQQPLPFYRTPNPQISYLMLTVALWLLYKTWNKGSFKLTILTAIIGVSLFTTYFYSATFFFFVVGSLLLISFLTWDQLRFKYILLIFIILFITVIFYKWAFNGSKYETLNTTFGVFHTRYFEWIYSFRYGFLIAPLYLFRKVISRSLFFYLTALIFAAIACMNFQLFTGWTAQPAHWPQTTIEPTIVIIVYVILYKYFKKRAKQIWAIAGIIIILVYSLLYQLRFIQTHPKVWQIPQDLSNVYTWINSNAQESTVVTSLDSTALSYVPVLTKANIFIPIESYHYATIDEIWERIFYNFKLYGFNSLPIKNISIASLFELTYNVNMFKHYPLSEYSNEISKSIGKCYPPLCSTLYSLPNSVIKDIERKYSHTDFKDNPYKLHFALYTPYERSIGGIPPMGKLVYSSGSYEVYQVNILD